MYHVLETARKGYVWCSCKRNVLRSVSGAPARALVKVLRLGRRLEKST